MTEAFTTSLVECDICRIMWVAVRPIETTELECLKKLIEIAKETK